MPQIRGPLYWDDDDQNINHLWDRHQVTTEEIEEIIFGGDGEDPNYIVRRDGDGYMIYGRTVDGRWLRIYGEFITEQNGRVSYRPIHSMDMNDTEKRLSKERLT